MQVTRRSLVSGIVRTRDIDVTADQLAAREGGALAQSNLSASDREFVISGMTDDEWDDLYLEDAERYD